LEAGEDNIPRGDVEWRWKQTRGVPAKDPSTYKKQPPQRKKKPEQDDQPEPSQPPHNTEYDADDEYEKELYALYLEFKKNNTL